MRKEKVSSFFLVKIIFTLVKSSLVAIESGDLLSNTILGIIKTYDIQYSTRKLKNRYFYDQLIWQKKRIAWDKVCQKNYIIFLITFYSGLLHITFCIFLFSIFTFVRICFHVYGYRYKSKSVLCFSTFSIWRLIFSLFAFSSNSSQHVYCCVYHLIAHFQ